MLYILFFLFLDAQKMPVSDIISSNRHHLSSLTDNRNYKQKEKQSLGRDKQSVNLLSPKDAEELRFFKVDRHFWSKLIKQKIGKKNLTEKENSNDEKSSNNSNSSTKKFNVVKQIQGQKRKTTTTSSLDHQRIKRVRSDSDTSDCGKMYDYRSSSIKTDNDYINKNEEDEENMINAFYQQRYLGGSNNSIATLCNIGNSCYLNSVIYTLRFAPYFLHKLHHLCDDMHYVYQKIGQNKLKSSSLGRNVGGLQVSGAILIDGEQKNVSVYITACLLHSN